MTITKSSNIIGGSNTEIFTIKEYVLYKKQCILNNITLNDVDQEYHYINNAHDKIFRKALEDKNNAIKIINRVLKDDNVSIDEVEKYSSSYISSKLANSEADIVYKVINQDIFFLIEHQTKIDYSMPYRILKYELEIIESVLIDKNHKNKKYKYPIVIPIVLYTGDKKWNAKLDLRKVQLKWKNYQGQEFSRYNILDINDFNNEELFKEDSLISKILIIEKSKTERELEDNLEKIIKIINKDKDIYTQEQKEFLMTIIQFVLIQKFGDKKTKELMEKLRNGGEGKVLAVLDMIDRENRRIRLEGKKEGNREGKIEVARKLLNKKMSFEDIEEVTGLSRNVIERLKKV